MDAAFVIALALLACFHAWCSHTAWRLRNDALKHLIEADRVRGEAYQALADATRMAMVSRGVPVGRITGIEGKADA